jgi:hypothetical protein
LETDYLGRGSRVHEALALLHRRLNELGTGTPAAMRKQDFAKFTSETFAAIFEGFPRGSPLDNAFSSIDLAMLLRWIEDYFEQHKKYDAASKGFDEPLRPAHFEVSFGLRRRGKGTDALGTEKPFELECGDETVRFSGRIDRIDIGVVGGQVVFNVLDYKTGRRAQYSQDDLKAGRALQLPIYAMAVEELLMVDRRAMPWRIGYWYLKDRGFDPSCFPEVLADVAQGAMQVNPWRELRGTLLARVVELVHGIRDGDFPVYSRDDQCTSHCEFSTVCRVNQVRAIGKTWVARQAVSSGAQWQRRFQF